MGFGSATSDSSAGSTRNCPSCGAKVRADFVLCVACGLDFRTGQKWALSNRVRDERKDIATEEDRASAGRSRLRLGLGFCTVVLLGLALALGYDAIFNDVPIIRLWVSLWCLAIGVVLGFVTTAPRAWRSPKESMAPQTDVGGSTDESPRIRSDRVDVIGRISACALILLMPFLICYWVYSVFGICKNDISRIWRYCISLRPASPPTTGASGADARNRSEGVQNPPKPGNTAPANSSSTRVPPTVSPSSGKTGPFGFAAGMTKGQVVALVGDATLEQGSAPNFYHLSTAPKPHPLFDQYSLLISPQLGLVRIVAMSRPMPTDGWGGVVKEQFGKIRDQVAMTYGRPKTKSSWSRNQRNCTDRYWTIAYGSTRTNPLALGPGLK